MAKPWRPLLPSVSLRSFEEDLLAGNRDANLRFSQMRTYLMRLGFSERIRGSHHVYGHPNLADPINLQPLGSRCKAYQVRQLRKVLRETGLRLLP